MAKGRQDVNRNSPRTPARTPVEQGQPQESAPIRVTTNLDDLCELLVALALACLVILRPWYDGMALATYNTYFLWTGLALSALVCARLAVRGERLRFARLTMLFAVFLVVATVTASASIEFNRTYRALLVWTGHFFLFVTITNGIRSRRSLAIIIGAFVITATAEALYSIIHLKYYMPVVRSQLALDPMLAAKYFGTQGLTKEIIRRVNTNRAFGSLLFPNALAGFMVLATPLAIGGSIHAATRLLKAIRETHPTRHHTFQQLSTAATAGISAWLVSAMVFFSAYLMFYTLAYREQSWTAHWFRWLLYVGAMPLLLGAYLYHVTLRRGTEACLLTVQAIVFPVAALSCLASLVLTYSRGGMLSFIAATAAACAIAVLFLRKTPLSPKLTRWLASCLLGTMALSCLAGGIQAIRVTPATAQEDVAKQVEPAKPAPAKNDSRRVEVKGVNMTAGDMADPATMMLRVSYWQVGLRMLADNPLRGVGLGNFGTAYPKYRYVGAGETQHAHNDYLQVFCETGVLGGLAFCGFWLCFIVTGVRTLHAGKDRGDFWLLLGLFAAVLASLLHAVVDFDFVNPSLAMFTYLSAAVFLTASGKSDSKPEKHFLARMVAVPFLVIVAVVMGASLLVHKADTLAGTETQIRGRHLTAQFFLFEADPAVFDADRTPAPYLSEVASLIPSLDAILSFGTIWDIAPGRPPRRLSENEPIPPNARLRIHDAATAQKTALAASYAFVEILEHADAVFPCDPGRAIAIYSWYDMLREFEKDPARKLELADKAVAWARAAVERSPQVSEYHGQYAVALMGRANAQKDRDALVADLLDGIEQYELAALLFPSKDSVWREYSRAQMSIGKVLSARGMTEKGQTLMEQAGQTLEKAEQIAWDDYNANRYRAGLPVKKRRHKQGDTQ